MDKIEQYYRENKEFNEDEDIIFQALSWTEKDIDVACDGNNDEELNYRIFLNGVTKDDHNVNVQINDFISYYYVRIPDKLNRVWGIDQTDTLFKYIKSKVGDGIVSRTLVEKTTLYPFVNGEKQKYVRFCFNSMSAYKKCKSKFYNPIRLFQISPEPIQFELYESNVDPILRFMHIRDIRPCGWVKINKGTFTINNNDNIEVNWKKVNPYYIKDAEECDPSVGSAPEECDDIAPFRIMSWDLECQSSRGFPEFPDANIDGDFISQIGIGFKAFNTNKSFKAVFTCLKSNELKSEGGILINCENEKDMLVKFLATVKGLNIDIITGYNTWGFDDKYLAIRISKNGIDYLLNTISRIHDIPAELVTQSFNSGAFGYNDYNIFNIPGIETFDLIQAIRREYKLDSYKLGLVAIHFKVDKGKDDLPYKKLFEILNKGNDSPDEMMEVCEYCMQDAYLVIDLIEKLCILPNYIEMAKSTRVPIVWLLTKGQQCKVFSQIAYEARKKNFVIPHFQRKYGEEEDTEEQKFKGATVLTARRGSYYEQPVSGLDFKSLYPSIMIAYNLCYSTFVDDPKYMNLPGIEYETIAWSQEEKDGSINDFSFTFVQSTKGILPDILERLWNDRNQAKKEMKKYKKRAKELDKSTIPSEIEEKKSCEFRVMVLNGKQLAIKVTMNSVYGFTGASKGMLALKPIAAATTAKGREMIAHTSKLAEESYDCVTTYGDSIPHYQPVKLSHGDIPVGELFDNLKSDGVPVVEYVNGPFHKEQLLVCNKNIQAWTHKGYQKLIRVIRHKTPKRLYKVITDKGEVTVTQDHSLIDINGHQIKPTELKPGSIIMHIK